MRRAAPPAHLACSSAAAFSDAPKPESTYKIKQESRIMYAATLAAAPPSSAGAAVSLDHLSWSGIKTYSNCPKKFYYRYIEHAPEEFVAASLAFGSAFHVAVDHVHQNLIEGARLPTIDTLLQKYDESWKFETARAPEVSFAKTDDETSLRELAQRMLAAYLDHIAATGAGTSGARMPLERSALRRWTARQHASAPWRCPSLPIHRPAWYLLADDLWTLLPSLMMVALRALFCCVYEACAAGNDRWKEAGGERNEKSSPPAISSPHRLRRGRRLHRRFSHLEYCSAFGRTQHEALAEVLKAKAAWLKSARKIGRRIPKPAYRPANYVLA